MKRLIFIILIGVILAFFFRKYCFEVIYIATSSMEPTYAVKDEIIINKIAYLYSSPEREDIILMESLVADKDLIKRIIGLPGDVIHIKNKEVFINGDLLEEDYVQYTRADTLLVGDNIEPFTIPEGHYFVMGDNRDVSRDSRDWLEDEGMQTKTVPLSKIKGKAFTLF
ncbi:signal peptidase I [Elusimicrobiota bacterium]